MRAASSAVPAVLLVERHRLGHDRFDEMWEGELHMVPPPNEEHQRIGTALVATWFGLAQGVGLHVRYETGLFDPDVADSSSYRQPDLVVFGDEVRTERGVDGAARLVVEICSPDDESFKKLPFYERVGVAEVLFLDRDTKAVRRWVQADGTLCEVGADDDGRHHLRALPVSLRTEDEVLVVEGAAGTTRI